MTYSYYYIYIYAWQFLERLPAQARKVYPRLSSNQRTIS